MGNAGDGGRLRPGLVFDFAGTGVRWEVLRVRSAYVTVRVHGRGGRGATRSVPRREVDALIAAHGGEK